MIWALRVKTVEASNQSLPTWRCSCGPSWNSWPFGQSRVITPVCVFRLNCTNIPFEYLGLCTSTLYTRCTGVVQMASASRRMIVAVWLDCHLLEYLPANVNKASDSSSAPSCSTVFPGCVDLPCLLWCKSLPVLQVFYKTLNSCWSVKRLILPLLHLPLPLILVELFYLV